MSRFSLKHPALTVIVVALGVVAAFVAIGNVIDRIDPAYVTVAFIVGGIAGCAYIGRTWS